MHTLKGELSQASLLKLSEIHDSKTQTKKVKFGSTRVLRKLHKDVFVCAEKSGLTFSHHSKSDDAAPISTQRVPI